MVWFKGKEYAMLFLVKNMLRYTRCKNNQKYFNGDLVAMLNYRLSYEC